MDAAVTACHIAQVKAYSPIIKLLLTCVDATVLNVHVNKVFTLMNLHREIYYMHLYIYIIFCCFFVCFFYHQAAPLSCSNSTFLCQNGGTCNNSTVNSYIGFKCQCPLGYSGNLCEKSKNFI